MKKLLAILIAAAIPFAAAHACTAFFSHEGPSSGMSKICYYKHLGDTVAHNVRSYQVCPTTIHVSH